MMIHSVEFESILALIDRVVVPEYLSPTQEMVLKETWNGKTYSQIAYEHNYESEYIKSVGCNLWKLLSGAFDEQINKSNFVPLMRQKSINFVKDQELQVLDDRIRVPSVDQNSKSFWTTSPQTEQFIGRKKELKTLELWSQKSQCRSIIVSGMVGCGKTILVTKFAKEIQHKFDYVIWFSLYQTPSLVTLIENYLKIINNVNEHQFQSKCLDINFLLSEFIDCLKRQKILLIVDGLENILTNNKTHVVYKKQFEDYGQFLRAIVTTEHQSLLIATTNIKPTMLEYYSQNQVKFLYLQGLNFLSTKKFLGVEENAIFDDQKIHLLSTDLRSNPQLLKIVTNQISNLSIVNVEHILQDLSLLEGIVNILEQELCNLSNFNREIIYWLSISCCHITLEDLWYNLEHSYRKINFLHSTDYLLKRSLIIKHDDGYSLMPVMKTYLRRKLIKQSLQIENLQILGKS